jgi:hypothetical protein
VLPQLHPVSASASSRRSREPSNNTSRGDTSCDEYLLLVCFM